METTTNTTTTNEKEIQRWYQFGYAADAFCSTILIAEPGIKLLVEKSVSDPKKQKVAVQITEALESALYEVVAALTTWANEEIERLQGKSIPVPPPPPFNPPPYPKKPDSLASMLIAILNVAKAILGEARVTLPATDKNADLIAALLKAVDTIEADWESIFGLDASSKEGIAS